MNIDWRPQRALVGLSNGKNQDLSFSFIVNIFITHADGSRVSIALILVCDSVCLSVRTIKSKRLKLKSPTNYY